VIAALVMLGEARDAEAEFVAADEDRSGGGRLAARDPCNDDLVAHGAPRADR
jgi:hypothetical protein